MERLTRHLKTGGRLALDTAVFITHFEANERYLENTVALFEGIERGRWSAVTSVITLMEITVVPWRQGKGLVAEQYEALLANYPNLVLAEVTRRIARQAARLRAEFNLRPADAIQAATALDSGAEVFVTNDHQLARLAPKIQVLVLDSLVDAT